MNGYEKDPHSKARLFLLNHKNFDKLNAIPYRGDDEVRRTCINHGLPDHDLPEEEHSGLIDLAKTSLACRIKNGYEKDPSRRNIPGAIPYRGDDEVRRTCINHGLPDHDVPEEEPSGLIDLAKTTLGWRVANGYEKDPRSKARLFLLNPKSFDKLNAIPYRGDDEVRRTCINHDLPAVESAHV